MRLRQLCSGHPIEIQRSVAKWPGPVMTGDYISFGAVGGSYRMGTDRYKV